MKSEELTTDIAPLLISAGNSWTSTELSATQVGISRQFYGERTKRVSEEYPIPTRNFHNARKC